jgi:WD40 repeat protein
MTLRFFSLGLLLIAFLAFSAMPVAVAVPVPDLAFSDQPEMIVGDHKGPISALMFAPDGQTVLSAGGLLLRIWDAHTGKEVRRLVGHRNGGGSAAFSPDGKQIASCTQDGTARLWDAATGKELFQMSLPGAMPTCVAFAPDGRSFVAGASGVRGASTATIWNTVTGAEIVVFKEGMTALFAVAFTHDSKQLLVAAGSTIHVWDVAQGNVVRTLTGHGSFVEALSLSPDGKRVLTASADRTVRLWDLATGKELARLEGHTQRVGCVAFTTDGNRAVSGGNDRVVRLWDLETGKELARTPELPGRVLRITIAPKGDRLLVGSDDGVVRVWKMPGITATAVLPPLGEIKAETARAYHQTNGFNKVWLLGDDLWTGLRKTFRRNQDDFIRVHNAMTGKPVMPQVKLPDQALAWSFSPDGKRIIVVCDQDKQVRVVDIASAKEAYAPLTLDDQAACAVFSPDGSRIATAAHWGGAQLWDARTGQALTPPLFSEKKGAEHVAWRPDAKRFAVGCFERIEIYDGESGRHVRTLECDRWAFHLTYSPAGDRLLGECGTMTGEELDAYLWDPETGKRIGQPMRHRHRVTHAVFSPDGKRIATGSWDKTARIWDAQTGQPLSPTLAHEEGVLDVAFSPDGKLLATGDAKGTVRLWDGQNGQEAGKPLDITRDRVSRLVFTGDGSRLLVQWGFGSSGACLWDLRTSKALHWMHVDD